MLSKGSKRVSKQPAAFRLDELLLFSPSMSWFFIVFAVLFD